MKLNNEKVFSNSCVISYDDITLKDGVMVITYADKSAKLEKATVCYYKNEKIFNEWWEENKRCPKSDYKYFFLRHLSKIRSLDALLDLDNKMIDLDDELVANSLDKLKEGTLENFPYHGVKIVFYYTLGSTCLIEAVKNEAIKTVLALLDENEVLATLHAQNYQDKTAFQIAKELGNSDIIKAFVKLPSIRSNLLMRDGQGNNLLDTVINQCPDCLYSILPDALILSLSDQKELLKKAFDGKYLNMWSYALKEDPGLLPMLFERFANIVKSFNDLDELFLSLESEQRSIILENLKTTPPKFIKTPTDFKLLNEKYYDLRTLEQHLFPKPTAMPEIVRLFEASPNKMEAFFNSKKILEKIEVLQELLFYFLTKKEFVVFYQDEKRKKSGTLRDIDVNLNVMTDGLDFTYPEDDEGKLKLKIAANKELTVIWTSKVRRSIKWCDDEKNICENYESYKLLLDANKNVTYSGEYIYDNTFVDDSRPLPQNVVKQTLEKQLKAMQLSYLVCYHPDNIFHEKYYRAPGSPSLFIQKNNKNNKNSNNYFNDDDEYYAVTDGIKGYSSD